MKRLLLFLFISSDVFSAQTVLISDIDDTIKITGVKNIRLVAYAGRDVEFFRLSDLYNYFICKGKPVSCLSSKGKGVFNKNIIYVTGAPGFIRRLGQNFLEDNAYPYPQNTLWKDISQSTLDFKKEIIEKYILSRSPHNKYILIGDNGEYDPQVYKYLKEKYPKRILATFIHMIYLPEGEKHRLLPGQKAYLTSVDLAVHFYNMKKIDGDKLKRLINQSLQEIKKGRNTIVKKWFACKYFQKMNWFPKVKGSWPGLNRFKKALFEHKRCR